MAVDKSDNDMLGSDDENNVSHLNGAGQGDDHDLTHGPDQAQDHPADDVAGEHHHFIDEELEAALSQFEREFSQDGGKQESNDTDNSEQASRGDSDGLPQDSQLFESGFDEELEGLIGNRAKVAVLVTRLSSAQLLAAFCQISDISADCVGSEQGAVAILHNLDGDAPEAAAKDITNVVPGMAVILSVNRADKLDSTLYLHGQAGRIFVPPVLFSFTPSFLEDVMLGISSLQDLRKQGLAVFDSADFDRSQSMKVIAEHTKFGHGASGDQ